MRSWVDWKMRNTKWLPRSTPESFWMTSVVMNNIGSAFRTADAFRIESIHLCGITARPPHREINKTALGATESVSWTYHEDIHKLIEQLQAEGIVVISVEQADQSTSLLDFQPDPNTKYAFVFGNEVFGVNEKIVAASDMVLEIPQYGTKHSLNISVSLGVVCWDFFLQTKMVFLMREF